MLTRRSLLACFAARCAGAENPPDLSGTWMSGSEFQIIEQHGARMKVVAVDGTGITGMDKPYDPRSMKLSADGMVMTAMQKTWQKQDSSAPRDETWFSARDAYSAKPAGAIVQGALAAAFNDLDSADQYLRPVIEGTSPEAPVARDYLNAVHARSGGVTVAHRAYARVPMVRDSRGRMMLEVSVAGASAQYQFDTGSGKSLVGLSEAIRLGLKLESGSTTVMDLGGGKLTGHLAVVPALSAGDMRLRSVTFCVVDDGVLGVPGILGIDVLLAFQTVRWDSSGLFEIGFPARARDVGSANLYFDGATPVAEVWSGGTRLAFVLDTGNAATDLFPRFASRFPDLIADGRPAVVSVNGHVGRSQLRGLLLPEVKLRIGLFETGLRPAHVLLQKPPLWNAWHHGALGLDLLSQAHSVTLDFQAMRLTLQ